MPKGKGYGKGWMGKKRARYDKERGYVGAMLDAERPMTEGKPPMFSPKEGYRLSPKMKKRNEKWKRRWMNK